MFSPSFVKAFVARAPPASSRLFMCRVLSCSDQRPPVLLLSPAAAPHPKREASISMMRFGVSGIMDIHSIS